jgi:hypothetical protein
LHAASPPASAPSEASSTNPAEMEPLIDGSIRFAPPKGWEVTNKSDDRKSVSYTSPDGLGRIDITVTPQPSAPEPAQATKMATIIAKAIRENAKGKSEFIIPPRVEKDERFFLKMRDRSRNTDDTHTFDRLQIYRVVGLNLVYISARANGDTPEQCEIVAKDVDAVAEALLDGMQLTHGARPVVFPRAQLRITSPVDWQMQKTDEPNGLVVTYTDPKDGNRQIIVRARIIPKDARTDETKRSALLDKMVDAERRTTPFKATGATPTEHPETVPGEPLRAIGATVQRGEQPLKVVTRYFVVADVMVSVRSVAADNDAGIGPITDALAATVKPVR